MIDYDRSNPTSVDSPQYVLRVCIGSRQKFEVYRRGIWVPSQEVEAGGVWACIDRCISSMPQDLGHRTLVKLNRVAITSESRCNGQTKCSLRPTSKVIKVEFTRENCDHCKQ